MIDVLGGVSNPLVESAAIGVLGLAALAFKRWRTGLALIAAAAAWAWLCATPTFALLMWQGLANRYPPKPPADYPHADAIVLVGGGPVPKPLETWNATTDPALATPMGFALALYRAGRAPILVTTGNYGFPRAANALTRQGVPAASLRLNAATLSTHQDATHSAQSLRPAPGKTILLVTTAWHMPRTVATFRKQGFNVIAASSYKPAWITRRPRSLAPHRAALYLSRGSLHEYIGLWYYRLRGWATW